MKRARSHSINLLPDAARMRRRVRLALRDWSKVLCVIAAAGLVLWSVRTLTDTGEYRQLLERVTREKRLVDTTSSTVASLQERVKRNRDSLLRVQCAGRQPDWSTLTALLSSAAIGRVSLNSLDLSDSPVPVMARSMPTAARPVSPQVIGPDHFQLLLSGVTRSPTGLSEFVTALQKSAVFDDVTIQRTGRTTTAGDTSTSFQVICTLEDGGTP
ncbi:MAG: PilN domain-containing protein [Tepidisphaeraceae bacterium]